MARLDHVVELQPVEVARQMLDEFREVVALEALERCELPQHGPELVAELGEARGEEALDEAAGLGEHLLLGDEARALDREDEALRRRGGPALEAFCALQAVMRGVDLDRGEVARGVAELIGLLQALGIKDAAPRREAPSADADTHMARNLWWFSH